jgi:hypothetical protein
VTGESRLGPRKIADPGLDKLAVKVPDQFEKKLMCKPFLVSKFKRPKIGRKENNCGD